MAPKRNYVETSYIVYPKCEYTIDRDTKMGAYKSDNR